MCFRPGSPTRQELGLGGLKARHPGLSLEQRLRLMARTDRRRHTSFGLPEAARFLLKKGTLNKLSAVLKFRSFRIKI